MQVRRDSRSSSTVRVWVTHSREMRKSFPDFHCNPPISNRSRVGTDIPRMTRWRPDRWRGRNFMKKYPMKAHQKTPDEPFAFSAILFYRIIFGIDRGGVWRSERRKRSFPFAPREQPGEEL